MNEIHSERSFLIESIDSFYLEHTAGALQSDANNH